MLCKTIKTFDQKKIHLHAFPWDKPETFPFDLFRVKRSSEACLIKAVCVEFKNNIRWFAYQCQTHYIIYARADKSYSVWDLLSVITDWNIFLVMLKEGKKEGMGIRKSTREYAFSLYLNPSSHNVYHYWLISWMGIFQTQHNRIWQFQYSSCTFFPPRV